jgi:hypothetical protein
MSDSKYQTMWKRRVKMIALIAGVGLMLGCLVFGTLSVFRDSCTGSYDRSPELVLKSFTSAIQKTDPVTIINCWDHNKFYELTTGCTEVCLERVLGVPLNVIETQISDVFQQDGRDRIRASMIVSCPNSDQQHTAELLLDTRKANLPWAHWKIIQSNYGGEMGNSWCGNQ